MKPKTRAQLQSELQQAELRLKQWWQWYQSEHSIGGAPIEEPLDRFVAQVRKERRQRIKNMVVVPLKISGPAALVALFVVLIAALNYAQCPGHLYMAWLIDAVLIFVGGSILGSYLDEWWKIE